MGFGQVCDNLTFKRMTPLRKKIQSVADHFLSYCFWVHAVLKQIAMMIVRIRLR